MSVGTAASASEQVSAQPGQPHQVVPVSTCRCAGPCLLTSPVNCQRVIVQVHLLMPLCACVNVWACDCAGVWMCVHSHPWERVRARCECPCANAAWVPAFAPACVDV